MLATVGGRVARVLPHLPQPLVSRLLVAAQRSTRPPRRVAAGIDVAESTAGGVPVTWLGGPPRGVGAVVYLHGGAYVFGPVRSQWAWVAELHRRTSLAAAVVRYRMPPRAPHPAALRDVVTAVAAMSVSKELVDGHWVLAGDSAGGGLALAAVRALRSEGHPCPSGLLLTAPCVDLEMANPALELSERSDPFLHRTWLVWAGRLYAAGTPLEDPALSPINDTLVGLPPVHLDVGTRDLFLPDIRRLRDRLERAQVPTTYIEQVGAAHTYPHEVMSPEARSTIRSQAEWVHRVVTTEV